MAYIIYNKKMALYLREKGFRIINTAPNRNKPFFDVYFFEDSENLQKEIQIYKSNYIQQEKHNGEKKASDR
jgi:hypothetical protein